MVMKRNTLFATQINVATQRGFIPVDELMRVIDVNGKLVSVIFISTHYGSSYRVTLG